MPEEWRRLAVRPLRDMQARALTRMAAGADLVVNAATGSGKGLLPMLPALAAWAAASQGELAPIELVVVPFAALGVHIEQSTNAVIAALVASGTLRPGARALFVRRSWRGESAEEPEVAAANAQQTEPTQHEVSLFARAARVFSHAPRVMSSSASSRRVVASPPSANPLAHAPTCLLCAVQSAIPCRRCEMCLHPERFTDVTRDRVGGCIFSCRVATVCTDKWCNACWKARNRPQQVVAGCKLRNDIFRNGGSGGGTPQTAGVSRTRSALSAALYADPIATAAHDADASTDDVATEGAEGAPSKRLTIDDLQTSAPERAIVGDESLALVIVTVNALVATSQRGRLLRDALVTRGVSRSHFDELDQVHSHGMASYNPHMLHLPRVLNGLAVRHASRGLPRPQRVGYTATLAPSCQLEVLKRAGFARDTFVLRASIDRPELTYARVPVASVDGETLPQLVVRAVLLVLEHAPTWATHGRVIVNCTLTLSCLKVAALLRTHGFSAHAYTTNNMSDVGRALSLAAFTADPAGILVPSEAWGQGVSVPGISLIINVGLKSNPVTGAQNDGRAAREAGERGLAVTILNGRLTAERLRLADPSKRGATVGPTLLLAQLCARGCMRERALRYLGGCIGSGCCAGCDDCTRRGAACAAAQPVGRLHDLSHWVAGEAAAVHLLSWLLECSEEHTLLTTLQRSPPPLAPPPFHGLAAHDRLVDSLIACGGLRVDGLPLRHGRGSAVVVSVDCRVKQLLEFGGELLPVLLPGDGEGDEEEMGEASAEVITAAAAEVEAAAASRRAEVRAQQFRECYAVGVCGLLACRELIAAQLDDSLPLASLQTTEPQRALVLAAAGDLSPEGHSPPRATSTTPTYGSVRPSSARNLFGASHATPPRQPDPEPPAAPPPGESSPRSLMGRLASAMRDSRRKRSVERGIAASSVDVSGSPVGHVEVTDGGSPVVGGGVSSAERSLLPKRRGVVSRS